MSAFRRVLVLLAVLCTITAQNAEAATKTVYANALLGDDSFSGDLITPVKSFGKAVDLAMGAVLAGAFDDSVVNLAAGYYVGTGGLHDHDHLLNTSISIIGAGIASTTLFNVSMHAQNNLGLVQLRDFTWSVSDACRVRSDFKVVNATVDIQNVAFEGNGSCVHEMELLNHAVLTASGLECSGASIFATGGETSTVDISNSRFSDSATSAVSLPTIRLHNMLAVNLTDLVFEDTYRLGVKAIDVERVANVTKVDNVNVTCSPRGGLLQGNSAILFKNLKLVASNLRVTGCRATSNGGGLSITDTSGTLTRATFINNTAGFDGGGLRLYCSSPGLYNCLFTASQLTFDGNQAVNWGGSLITQNYDGQLDGVDITRGRAGYGGGAYLMGGAVSMKNALVTNCTAYMDGGGIRVSGALSTLGHSTNGGVSVYVSDCVAGRSGGGMAIADGGVSLQDVEVSSCRAADSGGGILVQRPGFDFTWDSVQVQDCTATKKGGAVAMLTFDDGVHAEMSNVDLAGSSADEGGCMSLSPVGGFMSMTTTTLTLCQARHAGALHVVTARHLTMTDVSITWSTATEDVGGMLIQDSVAVITRSDVSSCQATTSTGGVSILGSQVTWLDSTLDWCRSVDYGGALSVVTSTLTTESVIIRDNRVEVGMGAGIFGVLSTINATKTEFIYNTAIGGGAGMFCFQCSLLVADSQFSDNDAYGPGAGISSLASHTKVYSSTFAWNFATLGGSIHATAGSLVVADTTIDHSFSDQDGGGIGIEDCADATVQRCTLRNNRAFAGEGGAIVAMLFLAESSQEQATSSFKLTVEGCTIENNQAVGFGGGMAVTQHIRSQINIRNNQFRFNKLTLASADLYGLLQGGGGLAMLENGHLGQRPMITSNTFHNNTVAMPTAATTSVLGVGLGGGLVSSKSHMDVDDNTFTGNLAELGGGFAEIEIDVKARPSNLTGNVFQSNSAHVGGGGVFWYTSEPYNLTMRNTFQGNFLRLAHSHGPNYAGRVERAVASPQTVTGHGSGQETERTLEFELVDHYGQLVKEAQGVVATVTAVGQTVSVFGVTRAPVEHGKARFTHLHVSGTIGGSGSIAIAATYNGIDLSVNVDFTFRACTLGEAISNSQCVPCKRGTFSWEINPSACDECPTGGICQGSTVLLEKGYYRSSNRSRGILDPLRGTYSFMPCLSPFACIGADNSSHYDYQGLIGCKPGYTGGLCLQCSPGFGRAGVADCAPCAAKWMMILLVLVGVLVIFAVAAWLVYSTMKNGGKGKSLLSLMAKTLLSYMQVVSLARAIKVHWPQAILDVMQVFAATSSVSDRVFSMDCILRDIIGPEGDLYMAKQFIMIISPFICAFVACLFWGCMYLYKIAYTRRKHPLTVAALDTNRDGSVNAEELAASLNKIGVKVNDLEVSYILEQCDRNHDGSVAIRPGIGKQVWSGLTARMRQRLIVSIVVTTFLVHPTVAKATMELFTCDKFDDGLTHLRGDMDVVCWQGRHLVWVLTIGLPSLIFGVFGIPFFAFLQLHKIHKTVGFDDIHARHRWGFLYLGLEHKYYYWEIIIMLRKVLFVAISVSLQAIGPQTAAMAALLVLFVSVLIHQMALPYEENVLDELERASLVSSFLLLYFALFFFTMSQESSDAVVWAGLVCMVVVTVAFLAFWVYRAWREVARAAKVAIDAVVSNADKMVKGVQDLAAGSTPEEEQKRDDDQERSDAVIVPVSGDEDDVNHGTAAAKEAKDSPQGVRHAGNKLPPLTHVPDDPVAAALHSIPSPAGRLYNSSR